MKEPGLAAGLNATFARPIGLAQAVHGQRTALSHKG